MMIRKDQHIKTLKSVRPSKRTYKKLLIGVTVYEDCFGIPLSWITQQWMNGYRQARHADQCENAIK